MAVRSFSTFPLLVLSLVTTAELAAQSTGRTSPNPPPGRSIDAAVYAALLDSVGPKPLPDTLLVGDTTLSFFVPSRERAAQLSVQFDSLPDDLPFKLESASQHRVPSSALGFPRPARVFTRTELTDIFINGPHGWQEFYQRYPAHLGYMELSPVAFSSDSLDALVYYEYRCGGLCGHGEAVWLRRQTVSSPWQIRKRIELWVP